MAQDLLVRQKLAVREVFYEFFNNNQHPVVNKHFNYKFVFRFANYTLTGSIGLVLLINRFHALFPDTHIEITSLFSEGDMVCAQWKMVLKSNDGGQTTSTSGITTFRFRSDKIIQVELHWNLAALHDAFVITRQSA